MTAEERVVQVYEPDKDAMRANLERIQGEKGRFTYPSREAPEGYTTIRMSFRWADVHPSWLRTMMADEKFVRFDEPGLPAVIKNERGAWAIRIDALQDYASGMRSTEPGDGTGAGYKYEPQVLKACKRALSAARNRGLSEATIDELQELVNDLKADWESGKIGKAPESGDKAKGGDVKAAEADAAADAAAEGEADFDFDLDDD